MDLCSSLECGLEYYALHSGISALNGLLHAVYAYIDTAESRETRGRKQY